MKCIEAVGYNAHTPGKRTSWWRNRGREVLARVKLFIDIAKGLHPDIKESMVTDFTSSQPDILTISHIETKYGDLICLKPNKNIVTMVIITAVIKFWKMLMV